MDKERGDRGTDVLYKEKEKRERKEEEIEEKRMEVKPRASSVLGEEGEEVGEEVGQ